jgi:prophage DNA circulation protein
MTELLINTLDGGSGAGGTWRERLQPASFRGVPFEVEAASAQLGRRTVTHEFPGRDLAVIEDLGRRAREITLDAFVIGDGYLAARDALLEAVERPGPGDLVHPYLGRMTVQVSVVRLRESTREGGMAVLTLTVLEAGLLRFPAARADTRAGVAGAAEVARQSALGAFVAGFRAVGRAVARAQRAVEQALADVERVLGDVTGPLAALVRLPANLAAGIAGSLTRLRTLATAPLRALELYRGLFGAGAEPPPAGASPTSQRAAANQVAVNRLVRTLAVIEACQASADAPGADYGSSADALAVQAELVAALDTLLADADDAVYTALVALRAALIADLSERAADLPRVVQVTPATAVPALVLAQRIYGDPTREAEIVARNRIVHPAFVPGGRALEVLRDAI